MLEVTELAWVATVGGPAGAFCRSLEVDEGAALRDAFRRRVGIRNGPSELTAPAWSVAGKVPS